MLNITNVSMEWTDTGAVCQTSKPGGFCPRCDASLAPNIEHRCGDRVQRTANGKPTKGSANAGGNTKA